MGVPVYWAIRGKRPGATEDHQLLSWSEGPLAADPRQINARIGELSASTISEREGREGSAPVAAVGPFRVGENPFLGLLVRDFSNEFDRYGRRIELAHYFAFSFNDLKEIRPSYLGLYHSVKETVRANHARLHEAAGELEPPGPPLDIELPPSDVAALAEQVQTLGFEFLAPVAAALFEGTVALVGVGTFSTVEDRLEALDAVAALLPYGYRAALSGSTWMESSVLHHIRLGFTDNARPRQQRVDWKRHRIDGQPGANGKRYLDHLTSVRGQLLTIDALLAALATPKSSDPPASGLDDVQEAIDRLERLFPKTLGSVSPERVVTRSPGFEIPPGWAPEEVRERLRGQQSDALLERLTDLQVKLLTFHPDASSARWDGESGAGYLEALGEVIAAFTQALKMLGGEPRARGFTVQLLTESQELGRAEVIQQVGAGMKATGGWNKAAQLLAEVSKALAKPYELARLVQETERQGPPASLAGMLFRQTEIRSLVELSCYQSVENHLKSWAALSDRLGKAEQALSALSEAGSMVGGPFETAHVLEGALTEALKWVRLQEARSAGASDVDAALDELSKSFERVDAILGGIQGSLGCEGGSDAPVKTAAAAVDRIRRSVGDYWKLERPKLVLKKEQIDRELAKEHRA